MSGEMRGAILRSGLRLSRSVVAGSVARARAAKVLCAVSLMRDLSKSVDALHDELYERAESATVEMIAASERTLTQSTAGG